ncbi:MAG: FAD-dependent monooxygenase [Kofleriaceae bacterium]
MDLAGARVGIVGGGIGGLASAIALRRHGIQVTVFERAETRRREGIALLLWSNAMRALAAIGAYEAVRARAAAIEVTEIRNAAGELLSQLPIGEWSNGVPTVAVRRPELVAALTAMLPVECVAIGKTFTAYELCGDRVLARIADGETVELDALIGADGLSSAVRAQLHGEIAPRALRQHAWVGVARGVRALLRPGITTASVGRGPRFWTAPLDDDSAFWYATLHHDEHPQCETIADLSRAFADWHAPIPQLLAASRDDDAIATQICDRPPSDRWGSGPVTLLGDAAHASTPDLGQGACQAIESAVVLASSLVHAPTIASGLRAYERLRMDRTATISRLCWLTSVNSTARSAAVCSVRDAAMRLGLRSLARGPLEWILAGQAC